MRISQLNPLYCKTCSLTAALFARTLLLLVCAGLFASGIALDTHLQMADGEVQTEMDFDSSEKTEKDIDADDDKVPHQQATVGYYGSLLETMRHSCEARMLFPLNPPPTPPPDRV